MASIASNPVLPGSAAPASTGGAPSGGGEASGTFMQLVTGMIHGNTGAEQLPSNLAAFLLTGDGATLEGMLPENAESSDTDEDDSDELALASLLAGLHGQHGVPKTAHDASSRGPADALGALVLDGRRAATAGDPQALLAQALDDSSSTDAAPDSAVSGATSSGTSPLQHMTLAHRTADATLQSAQGDVRSPVGSQAWADEIGTHLTLMAANGREAASLRLSPEHLGPLEVRISMKEGEVSVHFGASNPDTRSALEQSLPRLRELFASQGLVLGDANVSRDAPRDTFRPATFADAARGSSDAEADAGVTNVTQARLGLVDTYV